MVDSKAEQSTMPEILQTVVHQTFLLETLPGKIRNLALFLYEIL